MGSSKRKNISRSTPPSRNTAAPSLLKVSTNSPSIVVDSGTPVRSTAYSSSRNSSSSPRSTISTTSRESLIATSVPEEDEDQSSIGGPRPSIDDDNADGDSDLLSQPGTSTLTDQSGTEDEDSEDHDRTPSELPSRSSMIPRSNSTPLLVPMPNAFAPPFYNRAPNPLPPSPSLTSLLRPSFSSRPTTPDESESENAASTSTTAVEGAATEAAVAKSARDARTVPRASPKVPTYEYYGFVLYLTSGLCFLMYILWSYLPSPFLHQLGIYYYPNRWWSLAVPAFLVMLLLYIYVALAAYNTEYLTPPLGSVTNLVDDAANIAALQVRGANGKGLSGHGSNRGTRGRPPKKPASDRFAVDRDEDVDWKGVWSHGTDGILDVPIGGVCEILYGGPE